MKTFVQIGLVLFFGLVSFGVYKYAIQPSLNAAGLQASIPDCLFATNVGAASAGRVIYSADGKMLAITSNSRHSIIDSLTGTEICDFAGNKERTTGLCFSPNGKWLAYADRSTIHVKDMDGKKINQIDISQDGKVNMLGEVAFLPQVDGVIASCDAGVCVYQRDGKRLTFFATEASVRSVAASPDGEAIFAAQSSGAINKWGFVDSAANRGVQAHKEYVARAKLSPDGRFLVTHGRDHEDPNGDFELKVWSTDDLELIHALPIGQNVTDFAISGQSKCLLVSKSTGEATVFSLDDFIVEKAWKMGRGISTADISPDGGNVCFGLSKSVTTIDTDTHHNLVTGTIQRTRNGKRVPLPNHQRPSDNPRRGVSAQESFG